MAKRKLIDHPTSARLRKFAQGGLSVVESDAIFVHLAGGCVRCQAQLEPHLRSALAPAEPPPAADRAPLDGYDRAVEAALASVLLHGSAAVEVRKRTRELLAGLRAGGRFEPPTPQERPPATGAGPASLRSRRARIFPYFDAALTHSWELREDDLRRMLELAHEAVALAPRLSEDGYAPAQVADFQARAWAELANAHRVGDDLPGAEAAMARAFEHLEQGTGDQLLAARVLSLHASVLGTASRFRAALQTLSQVQAIHLGRGDRHGAGRALIKASIYLGCAGLLDLALQTLEEGMAMIDNQLDPGLHANALLNHIELLVAAHRFGEARAELREHRSLVLSELGLLGRLIFKCLQARIEAELGNLDRAERAARAVYRRARRAGTRRLAAVFELELAAMRIRQGRLGEAQPLIESAVRTLREQQAPAELFALLQTGRELAAATAARVQLTADLLRQQDRFGRTHAGNRGERPERRER